MSIYKKLLKIQQEIDKFVKDSKSHNYNYASGNQVLSKIRPLMNKLGLILKQEVLEIKNERMDYKTKYGEKSEILTTTKQKFTWVDTETGEKDENLFGANGMNDWEKGLGSALTYAERYFLLKYFHIPTDEDDIDNPKRKKEYTNQGKSNNNKIEDYNTYKMKGGKHKDKTLKEILEEDRSYLDWLYGNDKTEKEMKNYLKTILN